MDDQGLHRIEVVIDQGHDVPVPAKLAEQRLCMPDHQVGRLRPGEAGVGGEQGPSLVASAALSAARRASDAARSISGDAVASPSMRRNAASAADWRASSTVAGEAALQAEGIAVLTSDGLKL